MQIERFMEGRKAKEKGPERILNVMTWNILHEREHGSLDLLVEDVIANINKIQEEYGPIDILYLQEVPAPKPTTEPGYDYAMYAKRIAEGIGLSHMHYELGTYLTHDWTTRFMAGKTREEKRRLRDREIYDGQAIFSRYPFARVYFTPDLGQ